MVYSLFHVGYMVRKIDSIWEYAKDLKICCFLYKFCKNDFLGVFQGLNHIYLGPESVMFKFGSGGREIVWEWEREL